jgi:pilus assembly protein CpaB
MYRRLIFVLVFAVFIAGVSSIVLYRLVIASVQKQPKPTGHELLVAAHDLSIGDLIRDGDVKEVSWNGDLPANALGKNALLKNDAIGRGVVAPVYAGEPIIDGRLAARGAGAGLAATIPLGKRAVALRVNEVVGLAGFVSPGMRVDVLVAGHAPGATNPMSGTLSRTVLQNIEVLSAGQNIEKNTNGKPEAAEVVNLLVTPEQAEVLSLAESEAKVQLVLRNPLDTEEQSTPGSSVAKLFGQSDAVPVVKPAPVVVVRKPRVVTALAVVPVAVSEPPIEIFSGSKRTVAQNGEGH